MDEIDFAQRLQETHNADALREHWLRQPVGAGLSHCEDCGEEIPEKRRKAVPATRHCINCQNDFELTARRPL